MSLSTERIPYRSFFIRFQNVLADYGTVQNVLGQLLEDHPYKFYVNARRHGSLPDYLYKVRKYI